MRPKIDINKLKHLPTTEDMFVDEYGAKVLLRVMSSMRSLVPGTMPRC